MRKYIIAGNWKMFKNNTEAEQLASALKSKTTSIEKAGMIVCPPATALSTVAKAVEGRELRISELK